MLFRQCGTATDHRKAIKAMKKMSCVIILILAAVFLTAGCQNRASRTRWNTTRRTHIVNGENAIIYNNRIIFNTEYGMQSMNIDGSDRQILNDTLITHFQVIDDLFVFSGRHVGGYVFSMQMDGTDLRQLSDSGVWGIRVNYDWIFYISRNSGEGGVGIFKMRPIGKFSVLH